MWRQLVEPNLDPVIYQPNNKGGSYVVDNWVGWCLAYVATAFKAGWAGTTAWEAWNTTTAKRRSSKAFPVNVKFPMWFSGYWRNGIQYGHVVIAQMSANGRLTIWSTPLSGKAKPDVWDSVELVEHRYGVTYAGWSEDIGGRLVIEKTNGQVLSAQKEDVMLTRNSVRILVYSILGLDGKGIIDKRPNAVNQEVEKIIDSYMDADPNELIMRFWESNQGKAYRAQELDQVYKMAEAYKNGKKATPAEIEAAMKALEQAKNALNDLTKEY